MPGHHGARRGSILTGNHPEQDFKTSLISGCFSNTGLCLLGWIVPCFPVAKTGQFLGDGGCATQGIIFAVTSLFGLGWYLPCKHRGELRAGQNVPGSKVNDCMLSCFCFPCVIIQNAKESGAWDMGQDIARM